MSILSRASSSSTARLAVSTPTLFTSKSTAARTFASSPISLKRAPPRKGTRFDISNREPAAWREAPNERDSARVESTALAVRERRAARGISDEKMSADGLMVADRLEYERRKARGEFADNAREEWPEGEPTPAEWFDKVNARRNRIRGRRPTSATTSPIAENAEEDPDSFVVPKSEEDIVGRPIYLPDITLRLIPNHTLPGKAYNPWEATFYTSAHGFTKTDVRSYLWAMYGLEVTYIRTDNYYPAITLKSASAGKRRSNKGLAPASRKRIVVGLNSPFYYPNMPEDMTATEREAMEDEYDRVFGMRAQIEEMEKMQRNRLGLPVAPWGNRVSGKKNVMKARKDRRDSAEESVQDAVRTMIDRAVDEQGTSVVRPEHIPLPK